MFAYFINVLGLLTVAVFKYMFLLTTCLFIANIIRCSPWPRFQICVVDFVLGCILKMFMVLHVAVLSVSKYHFECAIVLHVAAFVLKACFLQADRQTDGRMDGRTDGRTDGQRDGQRDGQQTDRQRDRHTDSPTDGQTD